MSLKPSNFEAFPKIIRRNFERCESRLTKKALRDLKVLIPIVRSYAEDYALSSEERNALAKACLEMTPQIASEDTSILFFGQNLDDYEVKDISILERYLDAITERCAGSGLSLAPKETARYWEIEDDEDDETYMGCPHIQKGTSWYNEKIPNLHLQCLYCFLEGRHYLYIARSEDKGSIFLSILSLLIFLDTYDEPARALSTSFASSSPYISTSFE